MNQQRIGIIGAMVEEVDLLHRHLEHVEMVTFAGITFASGQLFGQSVVVCKSGIGKVNAAVCTQLLISQFTVSQIIFTGVAGALDPQLNIGDIVVSDDCIQHDIDVTALGFDRGVIPFHPVSCFKADPTLANLAYEAGQVLYGERAKRGRVLSGDQFIASREIVSMLHRDLQGTCTEMEGAAVAQVCTMNETPYVVIRSMSDKADGSAHINFAEFTQEAADRSFAIVRHMLEHLIFARKSDLA